VINININIYLCDALLHKTQIRGFGYATASCYRGLSNLFIDECYVC